MTRSSLTGGRVDGGAFEVRDRGFAPRPWPGGAVWGEGTTTGSSSWPRSRAVAGSQRFGRFAR